MSLKWIVTYGGLAYLMVAGVVMHAVLVAFVNILVEKGRLNFSIGEILKVLNFFLYIFFTAYVAGAVFRNAAANASHGGTQSIAFAVSAFAWLAIAFYALKVISNEKNS